MPRNMMKKWIICAVLCGLMVAGCGQAETPSPTLVSEPTQDTSASVEPTPAEPTLPPPPPTEAPETAPAPAVAEPIMGIQITNSKFSSMVQQSALLPGMGAHWVRLNGILWHKVEPNQGDRAWGAVEDLEDTIVSVTETGLEPIVIVRGAPAWAQKVPDMLCGPIHPDQLAAFGQFMYDVVSRYSAPPYNVKYWELGNEPDVAHENFPSQRPYGCWGDASAEYFGGEYYAEMLKAVYPLIKAADPEAQVVFGGLLLDCDPVNPPESPPDSGQLKDCTPAKFLEGALRNGGGDFFDGVSFHAYDYYYETVTSYGNVNWHSGFNRSGIIPVTVAKTQYLQELLLRYGVPDKFLMNTETALICGAKGKEPHCLSAEFLRLKAAYVAQSNVVAKAVGLQANVWYSLTGWRASSLVDEAIQPLEAFTAYQFSAAQLQDAPFIREVTDYPGVLVYAFQKGDAELWAMWSFDTEAHEIQLPSAPLAVYDFMGNPLANGQTITVTTEPIYVEYAP